MSCKSIAIALACVLIAGCGGPTIDKNEAEEIAALSQDSEQHLAEFSRAILNLTAESKCSAEFMREYGGFMKASGPSSVYFLYCNEPMDITTRWYVNVITEKISRYPQDL